MDKKQRRDETRQGRRSGRDEEEKLSKEVVGLITSGQISKAMNRVSSHGIADMNDPALRSQIERKYPKKIHNLSATIPKMKPIDKFRDLRQSLLSLEPGTAPGSGGMRP